MNTWAYERPMDTSYEVDLWGDNADRVRGHERMTLTTDGREYKCLRLIVQEGIDWFDDYYREWKQYRGARSRGPVQEYRILNNSGRQYIGHPQTGAFNSWKDHRSYQAHGRV